MEQNYGKDCLLKKINVSFKILQNLKFFFSKVFFFKVDNFCLVDNDCELLVKKVCDQFKQVKSVIVEENIINTKAFCMFKNCLIKEQNYDFQIIRMK